MRGKVIQLEWATKNKQFSRIFSLRSELMRCIEDLEIEIAHVKKYNLVQLSWYELFKNAYEEIKIAQDTIQIASHLLSSSLRQI
jgi:hypothetical protein